MIRISQLLEFEQLATESLRHDPETCHRLRNVLARCFTSAWDSVSDNIKMVVELVRNMKPLLAYRYPLLLGAFNHILPWPFTFMLDNPLYMPNHHHALMLLHQVQDRFRNEPWKYQSFSSEFQYLNDPSAPTNSQWDAAARVFILLSDQPDLQWTFCKFLA